MKSVLIQDTTREEREQLVKDSLEYSGIGCEASDGFDFYLPYIEGEIELRDLNMRYCPHIVKGDADRDTGRTSCVM